MRSFFLVLFIWILSERVLLAGGKELPEPIQMNNKPYSDTIPFKDRTGSFTDPDAKTHLI